MLGGIDPGIRGALLHARLCYFDPVNRRTGLPPGMAALVERLADDETVATLVNISPSHACTAIVQGGAYGEHQCRTVSIGDTEYDIDAPHFAVQLAPGCGAKLSIKMQRYANQPRVAFPWNL
jgi:hypothetical protein